MTSTDVFDVAGSVTYSHRLFVTNFHSRSCLSLPGLLHTPVTTFTRDNAVDWQLYGKLIDFHLEHGAEAFALPLHVGESVSLTDEEQRKLVSFVVKRVQGRCP